MRCLGCAGLTCTQKDPNNSARLTRTKESSTSQEGGDEDRGECSDLISPSMLERRSPQRPPRGGRSVCREASTELRPFALASGHHIGHGKRPEPYGGRPADELRAPRALLPLTLPNGQEGRRPRAWPAVFRPRLRFSSELPAYHPTSPPRREDWPRWDQQPSSHPPGSGLRIQ